MKTFFRSVLAAFAVLASASAMAQFDINQGVGELDTKVVIKPTAPGAAELTFTGVKLVYLNHDPKITGVSAQTDVSGKGKVYIVDPKAGPAGTEVYLSGIGRGGYAVVSGGKVNKDKAKGTALADTFTLPVTIKGANGRTACLGFTLLAVKDEMVIPNLWVSHPANASYQLKRGNGANDMTTVLCVDEAGTIAAATPEQVKVYAPIYTEVTTVAKK